MIGPRCLRLLLVGMALACAAPAAAGEAPSISVDIVSLSPRSRSSAPIEVQVVFKVETAGLLQGKLRLLLQHNRKLLYTYDSSPLSLIRGEQRRQMTLPTLTPDDLFELEAVAYWVDKSTGQAWLLGRFPILAVERSHRGGLICMSDPWLGTLLRYGRVADGMRVERFLKDTSAQRRLSSRTLRVLPRSMPSDPLGYCAYDLVLLIGAGLDQLKPPQLEALEAWIAAGGSIYIVPSENLSVAVGQFLEALRSGDRADPDAGAEGVAFYRLGLGRVVIDTRTEEQITESIDSQFGRAITAFLWKLTASQSRHVTRDGYKTWRVDQEEQDPYNPYGNVYRPNNRRSSADLYDTVRYYPQPVREGSQLLAALMPEHARMISMGIIVAILFGYLLLIGPLDYFVLGRLRCRKLTWLLFPLVTASVTWLTVQMCNASLGRSDHRRAMTIVDLGVGGRVLRENRFELLFASTETTASTQVQDAILTPVNHRGFEDEYMSDASEAEAIYQGRFPRRFDLNQKLYQWTPQLNRTLRIATDSAATVVPALNWDAPSTANLLQPAGRDQFVRQLLGDQPFDGRIMLMNEDVQHTLNHDRWNTTMLNQQRRGQPRFPASDYSARAHGTFPDNLLPQACRRRQIGFFSVVSQISPTGGGNFEDLTILDPTDPEQWLLVVIMRQGDGYVVYRRLYWGDS
jgi:hypothetical protein